MRQLKKDTQKGTFYTQLIGDIGYNSIREVIHDIDEANCDARVNHILLTIVSHGGDLLAAFALYDHIRASHKTIDIVAEGVCMSAAVTVLQAGHRRFSSPHTIFMVHPSISFVEEKSYNEFLSIVDQFKKNHDLFVDLTINRSGMDRNEFERIYNPRKYLTPEEALNFGEHGLIDEIIRTR